MLCYSPCLGYIALGFVLTVVPDQEARDDEDHSTRNQPHQESGHIKPAAFVLFCGKLILCCEQLDGSHRTDTSTMNREVELMFKFKFNIYTVK